MEYSWGSVAAAVLELQYCYRNEIKLGSVAAAVLELQYCYWNGIKLGEALQLQFRSYSTAKGME